MFTLINGLTGIGFPPFPHRHGVTLLDHSIAARTSEIKGGMARGRGRGDKVMVKARENMPGTPRPAREEPG